MPFHLESIYKERASILSLEDNDFCNKQILSHFKLGPERNFGVKSINDVIGPLRLFI